MVSHLIGHSTFIAEAIETKQSPLKSILLFLQNNYKMHWLGQLLPEIGWVNLFAYQVTYRVS